MNKKHEVMISSSRERINNIPQKRADYKTYFLFVAIMLAMGTLITKEFYLPRILIATFALTGITLILIKSVAAPAFPLFVLAAYLPFSKILIGQFGADIVGFNLTNILIGIVVLCWLARSLSRNERLFTPYVTNPVIMLFCLLGLFSLMKAKYAYGNLYDLENYFVLFKRWVTPILLYFIGLNVVKDKSTFKKVLFVMMTATLIVALMAIRDYSGDSGNLDRSRIGGVFEQPNMLGAFFVYNMFFFLGFFLYYWKIFKYWLLLLPFLACFRGIMVTFSRGAYMAFIFGSLMTSFFKSKALFILVLALFIAGILIPGVFPEGMYSRLAATFGGREVFSTDVGDITDASASGRILIWKGAVEMIKAQPFFGFGYGTFQHLIGLFAPAAAGRDAHNTYLIIAAEMGVPELILFLIILFMFIKHSRWLLKNSKDKYFKAFALGMLGGLFGLLAANMFGSRLNSEEISAYFWLLGGLLARAVIMRRTNQIA